MQHGPPGEEHGVTHRIAGGTGYAPSHLSLHYVVYALSAVLDQSSQRLGGSLQQVGLLTLLKQPPQQQTETSSARGIVLNSLEMCV
jgi:hypothetical protein